MDSEYLSFQGTLDSAQLSANLPPRRVMPMVPQPVIPWTPRRLGGALLTWMLEETPIPAPNDA